MSHYTLQVAENKTVACLIRPCSHFGAKVSPPTIKVCGCVIQLLFLVKTSRFIWCVVRWGLTNKHHENICMFDTDWTTPSNSNNYSTCTQTPHPIVNTTGRTYVVFSWGINKHALPITVTKSREVWFSIRFMLMLHRRFANAPQVSLCKSNW